MLDPDSEIDGGQDRVLVVSLDGQKQQDRIVNRFQKDIFQSILMFKQCHIHYIITSLNWSLWMKIHNPLVRAKSW